MNAIEFQNRYTRVVKDFFSKCLEYEQMPLRKMQDITICCTDKGFDLRLETVDYSFSQEFEVDNKEITPLHFETH
jgi:hypothetical protein